MLFVEVGGEDRDVHRQHATGVVADQQRAAGRDVLQPSHLGPEVPLEEGPHDSHDAFGQTRIPLGELRRFDIGHGLSPSVKLKRVLVYPVRAGSVTEQPYGV